ncbi:MAG: LptF/LptG family permease, partial [Spirochaetaceae bacterium]|nr:LptF/LptG family permease [Spirochaetaceae bacterium]
FALPIGLLFAISYTLGNLYANNELIAIFGSGISIYQFTSPLMITGLLLCFVSFYFEDKVVIPTYKYKNSISMELKGLKPSFSNTNVTIISGNGNVIYNLDYYNDESMTMSNIVVIQRDDKGLFISRLDADSARWEAEESLWKFQNCRLFRWDDKREYIVENTASFYSDPLFNEQPETFRKVTRNVDEMPIKDAKSWVLSLKKAGLPYRDSLTDYYQRFSFALTPFIVSMISCALGGKFKKNILLMSLLSSLILSVVYYVIQMILALMAKLGHIPPLAGAWTSVIIFLIVGAILFRNAKT